MFDLAQAVSTLTPVSVIIPLSVTVILLLIAKNSDISGKRPPLPPGPKPRFLLGNVFDIPRDKPTSCYMEWEKRYNSDMLYVTALGTELIIVNSRKDAEELCEKRARNYSDRPVFHVTPLMGWDTNMAFMRLGDLWRRHRRVAQQHFRQDAVVDYQPIQLNKVYRMLRGLLDTPERFQYHNKMLSMSIPMSIMYGHDIESLDDPYIVAAEENSTAALKLIQPGYTLINVFPVLRHIPPWFPFATSQKMASDANKLSIMLREDPVATVKQQLKDGTAAPSVLARYLEKEIGHIENEEIVGGLGFTVYSGASDDTTISSTSTLFFLLATHPHVQKKAQEEIDTVVGTDRLPNFQDRDSLPYVEAIYRELLRWRPPVMLGVPHQATEEDVYRGYYIPKGVNIMPNIWAMTRDESKYFKPYEFIPERFFDADGKLNDDSRVLAYGFGRRICVGKHLASTSLWITIVSILATFNVTKCKDENGKEIEVKEEWDETGLITHLKPYQCSILPRSEAAKRLILEARVDV